MLNTSKLTQYSKDLKELYGKHTDSLFIDNLINAIHKHPAACYNAVNQWLKSAFELPLNPDNDNCIDTYNRSFYYSILEKIS